MKSFGRIFLRGLVTVLPLALTAWLVWWLASLAERTLGDVFRWIMGDEYYVTGIGIVAAVGVIFVIGLFAHAWIFRTILSSIEEQVERVPLIKPVYQSIRDFVRFFRKDAQDQLGRPVFLRQGEMRVVGFVTNESAAALGREDEVVVYLPMGYQLGGYSVIVPANRVEPIEDLNTSEAMHYVLTAGIGSSPSSKS